MGEGKKDEAKAKAAAKPAAKGEGKKPAAKAKAEAKPAAKPKAQAKPAAKAAAKTVVKPSLVVRSLGKMSLGEVSDLSASSMQPAQLFQKEHDLLERESHVFDHDPVSAVDRYAALATSKQATVLKAAAKARHDAIVAYQAKRATQKAAAERQAAEITNVLTKVESSMKKVKVIPQAHKVSDQSKNSKVGEAGISPNKKAARLRTEESRAKRNAKIASKAAKEAALVAKAKTREEAAHKAEGKKIIAEYNKKKAEKKKDKKDKAKKAEKKKDKKDK